MASTRRRVCSTLSISSCFLSQGGEQNEVPGARFCVTSKTKVEYRFLRSAGSFQLLTIKRSPRRMRSQRGTSRTRQTSTNVGGSLATGSPPTRRRPAATGGLKAMPPRRSPRLVEDLHCNRPASQGNSSPAKSSARVKAHDHPLGPIA